MAGMIVERASNPEYVSNTFLVADGVGGPGLFIDAGGPVEPLIAAAERMGVMPSHILLTHHHHDHVCEVGALRERWPKLRVLIHPLERERLREAITVDVEADTVEAGEMLRFGTLEVRPLHTPGHTAGMLSFLVSEPSGAARRPAVSAAPGGFTGGEAIVFTGDTLFRGSVGGVRASGHTTYTDLKDSIMGTLMELPAETVVHPGHAAASTVGEEWEHNPFIRIWRGVDAEGAEPCVALGEPATLVLSCEDYDGGTKAWVRWRSGVDDIVPGSKVQRG
jgi:hydroxyacylglutathione hydrolase